MKIALYYPWLYLKSGVERTILESLKKSKHEFTFFTNHYDKKNTYPEFGNWEIKELKRVSVDRDIFSVLRAALTVSFQKLDLKGFDTLLVHSEGLGDLITIRNHQLPVICYCHTPLRPVFDEQYSDLALKVRPLKDRIAFKLFSFVFKVLDQILWKHYSHVFFNSKESVRRAEKGALLKSLKGKYEVLHPGIDLTKIKPSWIYKPYFFLPGRIMWTKNIELAIKAFITLSNQQSTINNFKLIIAGQVDEKSKPYFKKLKSLTKSRPDIEFIVSPNDTKMNKLYSESYTVLSGAFNEDFGMTLLEGNAFGKPVIAINKGGPKESQINGKTGFLVSPNEKSFADAMLKLADNKELTRRMGKTAYKNVQKFGWNRFVKKLDSKIEDIVNEKIN